MSDGTVGGLALFVAKLERRRALPTRTRDAILALPTATRAYDAHQCILVEGDERSVCAMIATGLAARTRRASDGDRRIVAFAIPGDMVDLQSLLLPSADFDVVTQTEVTVATVHHADLLEATLRSPAVANALWLDTLVDAAMREVRYVENARSGERERLAHLLLELDARFAAHVDGEDVCFRLPLTHGRLGEALGMSASQVGHAIGSLRDDGLVSVEGDRYAIRRRDDLGTMCGFDRAYLHLESEAGRREAVGTAGEA